MSYPAYQCVKKVQDNHKFCSKKKMKSHAEGNAWVSKVLEAHGLKANEITKPYLSPKQLQGRDVTIVA